MNFRMKKPGLNRKLFLMAAVIACISFQATGVNRYTVSSGNWGNPLIWSSTPGGPPGAGVPDKTDDVFIENGHTITVTFDYACSSVTFTGVSGTLVINSPATLTLKNAITLNKQTSSNSECLLTGTGTLICVEVAVGSDANPPPTDGSSSVYTHTFTSSIAYLNISVKGSPKNNIQINSYAGSASHIRNGIFNLESGVVTVDGQVATTNTGTGNTSVLSMAAGIQSGTLLLNGRASPFSLSATGTSTINLNGTASLVNYCYDGAQTALATIYNNITLSGSGAKILTGVTVNNILSMEGLATASGTTPVFNPLSSLQYKGSSAQTTGIEFPALFSSSGGIIINNTNGVTLDSNHAVSSNLTFLNGIINTGTAILSLTPDAIVSGAGPGKYVNGNLQKGVAAGSVSKTFEIGDASIYAPVTIVFTGTVSAGGNITAKTTNGDHPNISTSTFNSGVTVNRYWTLTNSGVAGFISCSATFSFVSGDIDPGADYRYFYAGRYEASAWTYPGTGTLTPVSTQVTGITSFGDFQIGELPISSYRSRQSGDWNQISTWESYDGINWVAATGTPSSSSGYITVRNSHTVTNTTPVTVDQFIIEAGGQLILQSDVTVNDGSAIDFSVYGTLDCRTGNLTGTGSFLQNSFAELIITSPDGITASGTTGNIGTSIRTFSDWADFVYNGTVSQVTGNGLPVIVNNLTVNNSAGISLSGTLTVGGTLNLTAGPLIAGSNTLTFLEANTPIVRGLGTITTAPGTSLAFGSPLNTAGDPFTIPAGTFTTPPEINNFSLYRISGLSLNDQVLSVNGIVFCNGPLNTNGNLTLLSTPSGTALIDGAGTGAVTGNVTMQRYLPSGYGYKYISSPFQASTVGNLSDELDLPALFPPLYKYDESLTSSGWTNYVATSGLLEPLRGYAANFGPASAPVTVDVTGIVNSRILSVNLFNNNNPYTQGFNLVGNPYPSPINWDADSGWTKINIDNALYYFKASSTDEYGGTYSTYVNGVSGDGLATGIIPSMQGFFVHVSDGPYPVTATLGLDNPVRVTDLNHSFLKSAGRNSFPLIRLGATFANDSTSTDPLVIYFNDKAESGFDPEFDALKLPNTDFNVPDFYSISSDDRRLSINALPEFPDTICRIPLGISLDRDGFIIFRVIDLQNELPGKKAFITDLESETDHDLLDKDYIVYLNSGEYKDRFYLNLVSIPTGIDSPRPDEPLFSVYNSHGTIKAYFKTDITGPGNLTIRNLAGQTLFVKRISGNGYNEFYPGVKNGIYIVTFESAKFRGSRKLFIDNR